MTAMTVGWGASVYQAEKLVQREGTPTSRKAQEHSLRRDPHLRSLLAPAVSPPGHHTQPGFAPTSRVASSHSLSLILYSPASFKLECGRTLTLSLFSVYFYTLVISSSLQALNTTSMPMTHISISS